MAGPPAFLKQASKRRLDAALPVSSPPKKSNQGSSKGKVATFKNPGNKAGQGLMQKASSNQAGPPDNSETGNYLAKLKASSPKKPKTKVQPAAIRKLAAMKMAQGMMNASSPGPPVSAP